MISLARCNLARALAVCLAAAVVTLQFGCAAPPSLVKAPNLYVNSPDDPFAGIAPELQTNLVQVVYATDRKPETKDGVYGYGYNRSRNVHFGLATVRMGAPEMTWDQLATDSRTTLRKRAVPLTLAGIDERSKWPPFGPAVEIDGRWVDNPEEVEARARETQTLHALLAERLALTPRKELFVFVHGYKNPFAMGAFRTAQIWHFTGRGGVPVLFSWPAGSGGLLRGYTHDRESGEFANPHLKQFLRDLASCPEVKKIHLIAHSRGTDILATAVRELHLECRGAKQDTRAALKLGQIVLAAPDIDLDVFIERFSADRVGFVAERLTVYCSPDDQAIGLSNWLFSSQRRVGQLSFSDLGPEFAAAIKTHPIMNIVDVRAKSDSKGHGYFLTSPAALSDLILVLRDSRPPGAAHGRPLIDDPEGFWRLDDKYPTLPAPASQPPSAPGS